MSWEGTIRVTISGSTLGVHCEGSRAPQQQQVVAWEIKRRRTDRQTTGIDKANRERSSILDLASINRQLAEN